MEKINWWWKATLPLLVLLLFIGADISSAAEVPYYAQRDEQWNKHPLGYAREGQTIGDYGCGVSAAAMVLTYYGYTITPPELNDALKRNKGFSGSLLMWKADPWEKATKGFIKGVANYRAWHEDWQRREEILRENVEVGRPVIVYLKGTHYVVVTRYDSAKDQYYINDPWLGSKNGMDIPFEENAKGASLSSITQMVILYPQAELPPTVDWPSIRDKYIQTGGEAGLLGPALQNDQEFAFPGGLKGRVQRFKLGSLYTYSEDDGKTWQTFWLTSAMVKSYDRFKAKLGLPKTDVYSVVIRGGVKAARADFTMGSLIHYLGASEPDVILADEGVKGEYFANRNLEGTPALVRYEPDILFDWGNHAPAPQLPADGFSVRWSTSLQVAIPGPRVFHVFADDGVRLSVDGDLILDAWKPQPTEHHRALKFLSRGQHRVTLEYFDDQSAASVFWAVTPPLVEPVFAREEALGPFDTLPEKAPPLPPDFDPNRVVCNNHFVVDRPVTAQEVQRLLEAADTDLKGYRDPDQNNMLASEIIAKAIEDNIILGRYRLNPRLLLVKMEVESNTVWGRRRHNLNDPVYLKGEEVGKIVDWILFYGWPDDPAKVDLTKTGFTNQVSNAVRILSADFADLAEDGKGRNGWSVGQPYSKPIDGQQVTPANAATAALYIYTPHIEPDKKNIHWAWYRYIGDTSCDDTMILPEQPRVRETATILVFDVSGSMDWADSSGRRKIEAAREAALRLVSMIRRENEQYGTAHQMGVVTFSNDAQTIQSLTKDSQAVQHAIADLEPQEGTNLAAGLIEGARQLQNVSGAERKIVILLSDGVPTVYLNGQDGDSEELATLENEVLEQAIPQVAAQADCVFVIGFGDPKERRDGWPSIDEAFLRRIANATSCGGAYNARTAIELENLYIRLRHESTGTLIGQQEGQLAQGETTLALSIPVPLYQDELHVTLNWPGSRLELRLADPQGREVDEAYPGAVLFNETPPVYAIIQNPLPGTWQARVYGADVPRGGTSYSLMASTRRFAMEPFSPLQGLLFYDANGDQLRQEDEPALLGAPVWLQGGEGPLQIGDISLQWPDLSDTGGFDGVSGSWIVAVYAAQPEMGEKLARLAGESLYQEARQFVQAGLWDAAAEVLVRLNDLSYNYRDTSQWLAAYPELRQALARRYGELWSTGTVWSRALVEHTGQFESVAFPSLANWLDTPDEALLAAGNSDGSVRLWQVSNGRLFQSLTGHTGPVRGVAFSSDGSLLATGGDDQTVRLWQVSDGRLVRILEGHTGPVRSVAFSPDGSLLASGSDDQTVRLWQVSDGRLVRILEGHTGAVRSVAFSLDGSLLATGGDDQIVRLWDATAGTLLRSLEGHTDGVTRVAFPGLAVWEGSPGGQILASGGSDNVVRLWRVRDGTLLYTLRGHTDQVRGMSFSPDGSLVATGSDDQTVRLWRVSSGTLERSLPGHTDWVLSTAFSPDGSQLLSASVNGSVQRWGIISPRPVLAAQGLERKAPEEEPLPRPAGGGAIGMWSKATALPEAFGHSPAAIYNDVLYMAGGEGPSGHIRAQVYYAPILADGTVGVWRETTRLPEPVHYHATVATSGYLYVIGGYRGGEPSDAVYRARINADGTLGQWTKTTSLPSRLGAPAAVASGNQIYVLGGHTGNRSESEVYYATLTSSGGLSKWTATTPLPETLSWLSAAVWEGRLYAIAGYSGSPNTWSRQVYYATIRPEGGVRGWAATAPLPESMGNHVAVVSGGSLYVFGGLSGKSQAWSFYAPIGSDGGLGDWRETTPLPVPVHDHSAVAWRDKIYVLGGYSDDLRSYQSNVYVAQPGPYMPPSTPTPTLTATPTPTPTPTPVRRIAYVSEHSGSPQVWLMDADGSNKRQLTFQGTNGFPYWSADNRYLYYLSNRDGRLQIIRQELASGREEPLYSEGGYGRPVVLEDGQVSYVRKLDGRHALFVEHRSLFDLERPFSFVWSPDRLQVLIDPAIDPRVLYTVDVRTGQRLEVAGEKSWNGSWSPDGRLLYVSDRLGVAFLFVANQDGSGAAVISPTDKWSQAPAWSPDGRWIAYVAGDGPQWNLYRIAADGSGRRRLAESVNPNKAPVWEPNSQRLAYESNRFGDWDIFTVDMNGVETQLTTSNANDYDPAWSN